MQWMIKAHRSQTKATLLATLRIFQIMKLEEWGVESFEIKKGISSYNAKTTKY